MIEVICEFPLEVAHHLPRMPEGHKCRRLHGHSYLVRIGVSGAVASESGMIFDYAELETLWMACVHATLDHQNINDVLGVETTTSEYVAEWIAVEVDSGLPSNVRIAFVELWETRRFGARWTP